MAIFSDRDAGSYPVLPAVELTRKHILLGIVARAYFHNFFCMHNVGGMIANER